MGALHAMELADSELDLETQIRFQLRSNHYPPVPESMVPVCIQAIDQANEGNWEEMIKMPEGVSWRNQDHAPVYAIIEQHHLEFWVAESELD